MDGSLLLDVRDLSIAFGQHAAVKGISFQINAGETLGLVGESGSGKSAASLAVLRLLPHTAAVRGAVAFDGEDLLVLPEEAMRRRRGREIAMIFQEPMTALMLGLLNGLRREHGLAMLFISHDLAVVAQVADRVAVMQRGELVEQAPVRELFRTPQHPYTRRLLASAPTMKTDRALPLASG